ncbi:MAG TPA: SDR family oxidoreductase [Chloroflexota bacterium]|nr:SDR family oxidoreductase [Chloroflexota bacterium]
MELGLHGKVGLVTGGSEGIGYATALRLAQEGAQVAIAARRADVLEAAAQRIREQSGSQVLAVPTDVVQPEQIRRFVESAAEHFGRIDVLVNNAGRSFARYFLDVSDEEWQGDLDLKFMAAVRTVRLVVPHMRQVGGGRIINVVMIGGKQPGARSVPTSVSRAAGLALTKALSKDLAADRITVNAVCVGTIKSAQHERTWRREGAPPTLEEWYAERGKNIPLGRVGEAEEVGNLIAFLASDLAAYITGTAINIDGGVSAVL